MTFPDDHLLRQIGIGNVAVMGFFILSGFIISEAAITRSIRAGRSPS